MHRLTADQLRTDFLSFFVERGHRAVPSASLIPHDPDLLFTVAGMVPFKPYFLGEVQPPFTRATTVQKCVRAGGKDSDLEEVGKDHRHLCFFEMLGNFSFGDYFKAEAIPMAWEMVTELFGLDPEQLWVTVHHSDDEAVEIWLDEVGIAADRIQRLGADNWWGPPGGPPGPCGPCSEIFVDKGPAYGADGGPASGGDERFLEIWNLVFMQFNRDIEGIDHELPARNIDTGAGLERILSVLQGVDDFYEIDVLAPLVTTAQSITGVSMGKAPESDVSLRILAEHARTTLMLVSDGVVPSNEDRGYVLRRIIRRAVRHAYLLGRDESTMPPLIETAAEVMGAAYPEVVEHLPRVLDIVDREEEAFRRTLATGVTILDEALEALEPGQVLPGPVAFTLHDTHGFPLELTQEIAEERDLQIDLDGFEEAMAQQKRRAKRDHAEKRSGSGELEITLIDGATFTASGDASEQTALWLEVKGQLGETEFVGREEFVVNTTIVGLGPDSFLLQQTPFYAESGGQSGDHGTIRTDTGEAQVIDTTNPATGLVRHMLGEIVGTLQVGQSAVASIDVDRRDRIRRAHTATHLLHWALRETLGDHVKQQGSLVAPDRLRFDFSHFEGLTADQQERVENLANAEILSNHPVRHFETTMDHAVDLGAMAFFGDKYGDVVRVLEAGPNSTELCGGTHVRALGDIGTLKIVSEGSIGSNIRRIEAVTGSATIERLRHEEQVIGDAAQLLGVPPEDLVDGARRRTDENKDLRREVDRLKKLVATNRAVELADTAIDGVVVARVDGLDKGALRDLAVKIRDRAGIRVVVVGGVPDSGGAVVVAAVDVDADGTLDAGMLLDGANQSIQGGGRPSVDLTVLGGKNAEGVDVVLDAVRTRLGLS